MIATATHNPWRNVRRISRTEWAFAPRSLAIIGAVAVTRPMQKMAAVIHRLNPSDAAANSVGPSHPTITTSVAPINDIDKLVKINGQASDNVALG
jgi:hypothetical protein